MDAHSRGRADGTDPADESVPDSHTGNYELRPDHCGAESPRVPRPVDRRLGNADRTTPAYAPDKADQARALAAMTVLPAAARKQGTTGAEGLRATVATLGAGRKGAGVPISGPATGTGRHAKAGTDTAECAT